MKPDVTLAHVDEFLRLYQIGFVAVWPLLGLVSADRWSPAAVAALLVLSICFNTFGGVLNDISDLPSDRESRKRSDRWLVTGAVSERSALMLVFSQVPLMLVAHVAAGFRAGALPWLAAALLGQTFYDLRGKRSSVPPVAEAGQAMAAGCLACYGATCTVGSISWRTALTAVTAASMLQLANAFHGGLRDLHDDRLARVTTTPLWLGCVPNGNDVKISTTMTVYSAWWLTLMMAASLMVAIGAPPSIGLATAVECAAVYAVFVALHSLRKPLWDVALRLHVTLLAVPIMTAHSASLEAGQIAVLAVIYLGPSLPLVYRYMQASLSDSVDDPAVSRSNAGASL